MARNIYANANPVATAEVSRLIEGVSQGDHMAVAYLRERLGTSDGVFAFANLANVQVQAWFGNAPSIWQRFAGRAVVGDFRNINWVNLNLDYSNFKGADKGLTRPPGVFPKVAEGETYQNFAMTSQALGWGVEKFGGKIGFTWEAFINDPYNIIPRMPQLLANSAVNLNDANATRALVNAGLSSVTLPAAAGTTGNAITVSPILQAQSAIAPSTLINAPMSLAALAAAKAQLLNVKDANGNFVNAGKRLVLNYSPGLEALVDNIFSITSVRDTPVGAQSFERTPQLSDIDRVNNRYLAYFATGNGDVNAWTLSVAPDGQNDPVLVAFLAGEEVPEVRVSGLQGFTPSGGSLPFTAGSFDTDTFDLRVRMVGGAGTTAYGPLGVVYSKGTGAA